MQDIDMTGVDPLRWTETRRRVGVVVEFVAIDMPTETDRKRHAERLGLSVNQFMALVRAWRTHRNAASIACSGAYRGASRRPSRLSVDGEAKAIAARVIEENGPNAPFVSLVAAVMARCGQVGCVPPSRSTIWNMVSRKRQTAMREDGGVVVATCRVRLPVDVDGLIDLPTIVLAVRIGDGAVLAAAMPAGSIGWAGIVRHVAGCGTEVRIDESLLTQQNPIEVAIRPISPTAARSEMSRILGRGLDNVRLVYRANRGITAEGLLKTREDSPLAMDDARHIVAAAITRHNVTRGGLPTVWVDQPGR